METRPRHYPYRRAVHRIVHIKENGKKKVELHDDPGGAGSEVVRELLVCAACAAHRNGVT